MTLGRRLVIGACLAIVASAVVGLLVQRAAIRRQGIESTVATMRAIVVQAESTREAIGRLQNRNAFDRERLVGEFRRGGDLRNSTLYWTVPVVAAWQGIERVARQEGYEFRIPKHQARNPKNLPRGNEAAILRTLEGGAEEYVEVDERNNRLVYARPIRLTAECMACHGAATLSPTGDGRDVLGYRMEGWREGEIHGAFVLSSDLGKVDAIVWAGMGRVAAWMTPVAALLCWLSVLAGRRWIKAPLAAAIGRVSAVSHQTAAASSQIASASQQLAENASQQAATLEETSATLQEVSAGSRRNQQGAEAARGAAQETDGAAQEGLANVRHLHGLMEGIQASNREVGTVAKTIDGMAFQTNLLALNAAVEAARAGDAGLGFGVVAQEVRALAGRCAEAVVETNQHVSSSLRQAGDGVEASREALSVLDRIAEQARRSRAAVDAMTEAAAGQASRLGLLEGNLRRIDSITQNNAASAEENAAASEQLAAQAQELRHAVAQMNSFLE